MYASYGILVNGKMYFAGTQVDDNDGYQQHLAHVSVKAGDYCQLYDLDNKAAWAVALDTWSVKGFTKSGDKYNVTVTGCYDFYIKLKYGADQLYIGNGSDCGDGEVLPTSGFSITGNAALMGEDNAWSEEKAIKVEEDSYTFKNLPAGDYKMKIIAAAWLGFSELTAPVAEGLRGDKDNNICFTLAQTGDVKVTYTESVFKVEGNFYVKQVDKTKIKLVLSEEWKSADAKVAAWIWGDGIESQWTAFFKPLSKGSDTLVATLAVEPDSIDFVRFSPKADAPSWEHKEGTTSLVWGEMKDAMDYTSMVWTILDWTKGQWDPYDRPCQSYGLMIDGEYIAGQKNVNQSEWTEYMLRNLKLKKDQKIQICDKCNDNACWVMEKFAETSFTFPIQKIGDQKYYVVEEDGEYDFYIKFIYENDEIYVSKKGTYTTAVRNQCTDVLMQAFYNESYNDNAPGVSEYGNTRWYSLIAQADAIAEDFDLVWLPPSSEGDGAGYHPKRYSSQNSNWGSQDQLIELIQKLHAKDTKVVADIVINHCTGWTSWCDFPELDFGEFGVFHPDASYICRSDEVNAEWNKESAGSCYGAASGSYDDGENWEGARDWSHNDVYVQDMFKAYLKWLRKVIGYDGFRYDKGDGFNNWHHDNYNKTAGPYIAFMECYSSTDEIQRRIAEANYNLMALDFDTKWHVFNSIAGWNYCGEHGALGDGLLGRGDGHHAVTFIESHDWFLRPDNENEFGGRGNSMTEGMKARLLQANAFLLSMPGVPCVFYPHWKKYREFISSMIAARKAAGVHSDSEVKDIQTDGTAGLQLTVVGKDNGYLILCLGTKAHASGFDGFEKEPRVSYYAENDCGYGHDASLQIWVKPRDEQPTAVPTTDSQPELKNEKFMQNGKIFIRRGEQVYDLMGNVVR